MSGDDPRIAGRAAVPGQGERDQGRAADGATGRATGRASVPVSPPAGGAAGAAPAGRGAGGGAAGRAAPGPPGGWPPGRAPGRAPGRRPRWRRVLVAAALTLLLVVILGGGGLLLYARSLDNNMGRMDAFSSVTAQRPADTPSFNILLLGSDSRDPDPASSPDRSDTIILLHIPSAQDQAYLISIPRDLWVYIPPNADGTQGDQQAKINAATAWGGVPLMVQTVEGYTGVRVDHVVLLDFAGFVEVTDALGGVEMDIEQTITSIHGQNRTFEEGRQHLNGEEALDYIRQRMQFPDGDFTRMRNQQQFLRALMDKATSGSTLANPARLHAFLQTTTSTVTVDENFSLLPTALKLRNVRSHNLTFLTSPHAGTGQAGGQSVVFSDDAAAAEFYQAVRQDRVAGWVAANPDRVGG